MTTRMVRLSKDKLALEGTKSELPERCACNGFGFDKRGLGIPVTCAFHRAVIVAQRIPRPYARRLFERLLVGEET